MLIKLLPANASGFMVYVFEAAKFDVVPVIDDIYEYMFGDVDNTPLSTNFYSLGYESSLVMQNMGSAYFFYCMNFQLFMIVLFIDKCCNKRCIKLNNFLEKK